jgi:NitT/TauT family transport system ATP-binding protein
MASAEPTHAVRFPALREFGGTAVTDTEQSKHLHDLVSICSKLPAVSVDQMVGVTRIVSHSPFKGHAPIHKLAATLAFSDQQVVALVDFLRLLDLIEIDDGNVSLTKHGTDFARANMTERRNIFADELVMRIPIMRRMVDKIASEPTRSLSRTQLVSELAPNLNEEDSERLINHIVGWARYADLISTDLSDGSVALKAEHPGA